MPSSKRFRVLEKELRRLRKQFLPRISPTGSYSERKLALTIAYRVLAHAEIESYLEDRVWEAAIHAKNNWDNHRKPSQTLISIVVFCGQMMELPPDTLTPLKGNKKISPEKIEIDEKVNIAINALQRVIKQNHGLKELNLLALLLPIGIDSNDLDPAFLATMNTFGEQRGLVAHSSAISYRATQLPDPVTELIRIQQVTSELMKLDERISNLMQ
jgi:hypothetical protein